MKDQRVVSHYREFSELEWRRLLGIPDDEKVKTASVIAVTSAVGTRQEPVVAEHVLTIATEEK